MKSLRKNGRIQTVSLLCVMPFLLAACGVDSSAQVPALEVWESSKQDNETDEDMELSEGHTEEVTEVTEPEPDIITITISAAGDVTLGNTQLQDYSGSFVQAYDQNGEQYFLENVQDIFAQDDMTIVNFEGVLTTSDEIQEKAYNMKGLPEYIGILTAGSVEAVSFGNNHRLDYLEQGSTDTIGAFKETGIVYGFDSNVGIYEVKGIRIGIISVNEVSQGVYVEKYIQDGIVTLFEDEADLILVCCHWGIERENYPEEYQTQLGEKCIDWGADLVIGHHPHVLQGIDAYQGKYILYSLGNFCFGGNRNPSDKDTMIFQQTFTFIDGVRQEDAVAKVIPCSLSSVTERNNFQPTPATGEEWERIMNRIKEYSSTYEVEFGSKGELSIGE